MKQSDIMQDNSDYVGSELVDNSVEETFLSVEPDLVNIKHRSDLSGLPSSTDYYETPVEIYFAQSENCDYWLHLYADGSWYINLS